MVNCMKDINQDVLYCHQYWGGAGLDRGRSRAMIVSIKFSEHLWGAPKKGRGGAVAQW
jgi:hypothetical protein